MAELQTEDFTLLVLATRHPDGTMTLRYYGQPLAENMIGLFSTMAGPLVAEQILTPEEIAASPQGTILMHGVGDG